MPLESRIAALDDNAAVRLLQRFAAAQPPGDAPPALDAPLARQFGDLLDIAAGPVASSGEVARATLALLARDSAHRAGITTLVESPPPERYGAVETAVLVSAVLIALQTHVRFERDKQGKWNVRLDKKPTDTALLKDLIRKLLSLG